jgi:cardiolipin synthase
MRESTMRARQNDQERLGHPQLAPVIIRTRVRTRTGTRWPPGSRRGPLALALFSLLVGATCSPAPGLITSPAGAMSGRAGADGAATAATTLLVLPDDTAAPILQAIRGARSRVWLTMYLLTSMDAVAALRTAHDAGCDVRVLVESAPYGAETANLRAIAQLSAAGIDVRAIHRPTGLVHAKLLLIDGRAAYVMSLNLTAAGLAENREFAIVDKEAVDVSWAETLFAADTIGAAPAMPGSPTRLLASPIDSRRRIVAAIDSARSSVEVEMEELSDDAVAEQLLGARARGVAIEVVAPGQDRSAATTATLLRLAAGGISVDVVDVPTIHAKAMSIDGRRAYVGSVNFTRASFDDNREYGILLDEEAAAARIARIIASDASTGRPLLPATP